MKESIYMLTFPITIAIVGFFIKRMIDKSDEKSERFISRLENIQESINLLKQSVGIKQSRFETDIVYLKRDLEALDTKVEKDLNNLGNKISSIIIK